MKAQRKNLFQVLFKDRRFEVREYPPTQRTIFLQFTNQFGDNSGKPIPYYLQFPYQIFAFRKETNYQLPALFAALALKTNAKTILLPPFPNIYRSFGVCLGEARPRNIEAAISEFWQQPFVYHDSWAGVTQIGNNRRNFWKSWQRMNYEQMMERFRKFRRTNLEKQIAIWYPQYLR